jgi:subtilase family serine protease
VNRIRLSKFFVFLVVSLFIVSYLPQVEITTSAAQPDDEWVAEPMHITQLSGSSEPIGYSPDQIRTAYGLPSSGGAGTTIAIIDAYNTTTIWNDLTVFSTNFSLPPPTASNFEIYNMSTNIGTNSKWAEETCLDVEWAHAIAPDAKILLVQAIDNSGSNLLSAVDYARNRSDVVAVSMS